MGKKDKMRSSGTVMSEYMSTGKDLGTEFKDLNSDISQII